METNLSIEIFTQNPFAWTFVLACLIGLAYAMKAIKKEKSIFIENSVPIEFGPYILKVPGWWSITLQNENELKFERTDTRYDWFAIFKIEELQENSKSIVEEFTDEIHLRKLMFDTDAGVIHQPESTKQKALMNADVARVEGTATQNGIERVYYDAMLARDKETNKRLWAESRSSVLNGLVEGPYFEYVIQNLEKS
tara:strand:+ start:413 stop:1000 length:588 start_codon:yes stop_codon:yes gene_type:complete